MAKLAIFAFTTLEPVVVEIVGGNEVVYNIPWPKTGTLKHLAKNLLSIFVSSTYCL